MVQDALWFGFLFTTLVVVVSLGVGGLVVVAYLLFPPVRKSLDRQMNRQDEKIWAETLAFVDAEKAKYQRAQREGDLRRSLAGRPVFIQRVQHGRAVEEEYDRDRLPF